MTDEVTGGLSGSLEGSVQSAAEAIEALMSKNERPQEETPQTESPEAPAQASEQAEQTETAAGDETQDRSGEEAASTDQPSESDESNAAVEGEVVVEQPQPKPQAEQPDPKALEANTALDRRLTELSNLVPQVQALIQVQFPDIKTHEDLLRLVREDQARYNEYVILTSQLSQLAGEQSQLGQRKLSEWQSSEVRKLGDLIPDLKDPQKAPKVTKDIRDYAVSRGYTQQQLSMASAADFAVLHDAMMGKQARDSAAKEIAKVKAESEKAIKAAREKAAIAPPVQKPGAVRQVSSKDVREEEAQKRFQKSGRIEDLANLLAIRN